MDAQSLCDIYKDLRDVGRDEIRPDVWAIVDKCVDAWRLRRPENPPKVYENPWEEITDKQEEQKRLEFEEKQRLEKAKFKKIADKKAAEEAQALKEYKAELEKER